MTSYRWFPPPSPSRCPDCEGQVVDQRCSACGLVLRGPGAATLWWLDRELHRLSAQRTAVLSQLRAASPLPAPPAGIGAPPLPPPPPVERPETSSHDLQNVLLGLGAFLVAIASIVFATVTWTRLSAGLQGLVLAGMTAAAATGTAALRRRGLKATAEAVAAVSVFLALIDLHAVRISLVPGIEPLTFWSMAVAVLGLGAAVYGRFVKVVAASVTATVAIQLCLPFLLIGTHASPSVLAFGLLGQAAVALTLLAVVGPTRTGTTRFLVGAGAAAAWFAGTAVTIGSLSPSQSWTMPALLVLAAIVAALAAMWSEEAREPALGASTALSVGAAGLLLGHVATGDVLLLTGGAISVGLVAAMAVLGRRGTVGSDWLRAPGIVASAVAGAALVPLVEPAAQALAGPLSGLDHVWNGDLAEPARASLLEQGSWAGSGITAWYLGLFGLALAAVWAWLRWVPLVRAAAPLPPPPTVAGTARTGKRTPIQAAGSRTPWAVVGWLVVAVPMAPLLVDAPIVATVAWLLAWTAAALAVLVVRGDRPDRLSSPFGRATRGAVLPAWALLLVTGGLGLAWALATPWATVGALGALLVLAATATLLAPPRPITLPVGTVVTAGLAIVLVPTVQRAAGASTLAAWMGLSIAAVVASAGAWFAELSSGPTGPGGRRTMLASVLPLHELTCAVLAAVGLLGVIDVGTADQASIGLALITVAVAAHSTRPTRRFLVPVAVLGALCLIWQRLALGQVTTVEAYSLPAAAALLAAGWWYRDRAGSSWEWSGPALAAAFGPTTLVALGDPGLVRPLGALVAAAALVLLGARLRLIAPVWVGAAVLVAIGLRHLGPVVDVLPRWVLFGVAGTVLLSVGATYERRRLGLARLTARLRAFR